MSTSRDVTHTGATCVGERKTLTAAAQRMGELGMGALPIPPATHHRESSPGRHRHRLVDIARRLTEHAIAQFVEAISATRAIASH